MPDSIRKRRKRKPASVARRSTSTGMAPWKDEGEGILFKTIFDLPPRKLTWIPKIAIFERRYILKTIIFGIYVRFRRGKTYKGGPKVTSYKYRRGEITLVTHMYFRSFMGATHVTPIYNWWRGPPCTFDCSSNKNVVKTWERFNHCHSPAGKATILRTNNSPFEQNKLLWCRGAIRNLSLSFPPFQASHEILSV